MQVSQKRGDTRQKIIEAAIELFKDRGYSDVSVKDICDHANVTRNSFYYYFDTKDLLFDSIGDWVSITAKQRINDIFGQGSHYQQFWEFYRVYLDVQLEMGPDIMNHVLFARTQKGRADHYAYLDDSLSRAMIRLLTLAQKEGQIRNLSSPVDLLWTSYAVIRGTNIKWCFQWGEPDIITEARSSFDVLFMPNEGFELK
ncbi:MAG: TetR/AcrR family transcriptional regulator [Oscillospiraceae bacterium]|nr:TetR/AcrR family transcriptional regulator [Oscillospiraceae bacterium]